MNENKNESSCQGVLLLLKNGYNWYIFVQFRGNLKTYLENIRREKYDFCRIWLGKVCSTAFVSIKINYSEPKSTPQVTWCRNIYVLPFLFLKWWRIYWNLQQRENHDTTATETPNAYVYFNSSSCCFMDLVLGETKELKLTWITVK